MSETEPNERPEDYTPRHAEYPLMDTVKKHRNKLIAAGAAVVLVGGIAGIAKATSSAEEPTELDSGFTPDASSSEIIGDALTAPGNSPETDNFDPVSVESQGEDCSSTITLHPDGTLEVSVEPDNTDNSWTAVRKLATSSALIYDSNNFEAEKWDVFGGSSTVELFAVYPGTYSEDDEFDPDNRNHQKCGAFALENSGGESIIVDDAPELESPEPSPSTEPTPEPEESETKAADPFAFEYEEFNGQKFNCSYVLGGDGETSVEVFHNGGNLPSGYTLAVSAVATSTSQEYIAFVKNQKATLPNDDDFVNVKSILVDEDLIPGYQEAAHYANHEQFKYAESLLDGTSPRPFEDLYDWRGSASDYQVNSVAGICNNATP